MTKDEALQMCLEYIETDAHERKYVRHAIKAALEAKDEPVACGACNGSGRMVRDPDIGTDQECFVCEGALEAKDEPVAWMYDWIRHDGEFIQDWTTSDAETLRDTEPTIINNVRPLYLHPETTQRCYCGDIYRLGVVHREHSFCDEHPQEKPQCPDCGASVMYECVACGSNNYPEGFVKAKTSEFPVPLAWCRWSEDMQRWLYTSRQPTEELAWIPLYPHTTPPQRTWVGLTDTEIDQGLCRTNYAMQTAGAWRDGVEWAIKQLQERNS
jgi:hypothetical protein